MNARRSFLVPALMLCGTPLYAAPQGLHHVRIVGALKAGDYSGPYKDMVLGNKSDLLLTLEEQGIDHFYVALRSFQAHVDGRFLFKADGMPSIHVTVSGGSVSDDEPSNPRTWVFGKIDPADLGKVRKGVFYTPVPENKSSGYDWSVDKGIRMKLK